MDDADRPLSEVDRLTRLVVFYEAENVRLKQQAELAEHNVEAMKEFNQTENKRFHGLQKKLTTLEANLKLETRASDGIRKKAASLDIECQLLKEQDVVFRKEAGIFRRKVKEYEDALCDDRAKRLKDMHQCELLRRRNAELEARGNVFEADAVKARSDLLEKMQKLESALATVENQGLTIEAQGEEMLSLNREISVLKETIQSMGETIVRLEKVAAERTAERDIHEQEAMRLRTEIMGLAQTHGERSLAYGGGGSRIGSSQSRSRPGTGAARTPSSRGGDRGGSSFTFDGPASSAVSFGGSTFFDESSPSPMLSPISTRGRPKSQGGGFELVTSPSSASGSRRSTPLLPPALKRNTQLPSIDTSFNDTFDGANLDNSTILTTSTFGADLAPPQLGGADNEPASSIDSAASAGGMGAITAAAGSKTKSNKTTKTGVANKTRTLYVGQGLGYKSEPMPQNHQSAKQVLAKILLDFQSQ